VVTGDPVTLAHAVRDAARGAALYGVSARHILPRGGPLFGERLSLREERLVFVVGSPRSGTTFLGRALGALPGFVDLGEVTPLKGAVARLAALPEPAAARQLRQIVERVRRLALVPGLRGVEQTPETAFVLGAALRAYPQAAAMHIVRDGRDVVCSLLEQGWLSSSRSGRDDAGLSYGAQPRFWVEPARREEFGQASDAKRAAWAWRAYTESARRVGERRFEIRYERLAEDPARIASELASWLDVAPADVAVRLEAMHDRSIGRFRKDLSADQLADVEVEAGALLAELGYT
jgi:hypothetical protein